MTATLQAELVQRLERADWLCPEMAAELAAAILTQWPRVVLWAGRRDPETGQRYSWVRAARIVAEHGPAFDLEGVR
jgi:hypothetical protein